jgi:hypothetical protein
MIHIIAQNVGVEHDRTAVRRSVTMAANKLLSEYNGGHESSAQS